jgi:RNA polymerase sigma factor (sigma-70 family)
MKEIRVKVSVRNNLIMEAIEKRGYKYLTEFARDNGVRTQYFDELVTMRIRPINEFNGQFCPAAKKLMEILGCAPCELFTKEQLTLKLNKNTSQLKLSMNDIKQLMTSDVNGLYIENKSLDEEVDSHNLKNRINNALSYLTPRQATILTYRYGLNDCGEKSLDDISKQLDISTERVRQIEFKALRKIRDFPHMKKEFIDY